MTDNFRSAAGAEAVRLARAWLGTPYRHQAALKGIGCDCLGLIRGIYAELYGQPAEEPPPYSRDWAEATGRETMIDAAGRHLSPVPRDDAKPGDILIFRLRSGAMAKHAAIMTADARMIHAMEGAPVCEIHITPWWRRRIAAVFRFPDQEK
ncbi:MAG: peptidase P60 [Rhodomicrobium sp.]|nr:peptidase P60 [Rhodomicrobium sp.]